MRLDHGLEIYANFHGRTDVTNMDTLERTFTQVGRDFGSIDNWYGYMVTLSTRANKPV